MRHYRLHRFHIANALRMTWLVLLVVVFTACGGRVTGPSSTTPSPITSPTPCPSAGNSSSQTAHSGNLSGSDYIHQIPQSFTPLISGTGDIVGIGGGAHTDDGGTISFDDTSNNTDSTNSSAETNTVEVTLPQGSLPKGSTTLELFITADTSISELGVSSSKILLDPVCAYATAQATASNTPVSIGFDAQNTTTSTDVNANTVVTADARALSKVGSTSNIVEYEGYAAQPATNQITITVYKVTFDSFAITPSTQVDGFPCPISIQTNQPVDATVQFINGSGTVLTLINPGNSTGTPTPCPTPTPTS